MASTKAHLSIMDLGFMLNDEQPISEAMTDSYINTRTQEYLRTCMLVEEKARKTRDSALFAAAKSSNVPRPLEKFECFGKFPPELRVMIWNYTMPVPSNGKRVLRVKAYLESDGVIRFKVWSWDGRHQFRYPATSKEMQDRRLSEVCYESGCVYLKTFENFLPGHEGDTQIRFTNDTTVFITNFRELVRDVRKMDAEMNESEGESVVEPLYSYYSNIRILGFDTWYSAPAESPWPEHDFPMVDLIEKYAKDYERWDHYAHHILQRTAISETHLKHIDRLLAQERSTKWMGPKIVVNDPNILCYCTSHGPKECAKFMRTINLDGYSREVPPLQGNVEAKILHAYQPCGPRKRRRPTVSMGV